MYSYISLFSSAGVGCFGLSKLDFECIATAELIERRLNIQRINKKCVSDDGYICGDLSAEATKSELFRVVKNYQRKRQRSDIDLVIATPPCQGMSVANHKKKGEIVRNSLVIESIKIIDELKPKYFVFENVRAFLKSACVDIDGVSKSIGDAINQNLGADYYMESRILNFKNYGAKSSRTRTLVIGSRKNLREVSPTMLFPDYQDELTLQEVIGHLPSLKKMGEFHPDDFYHSFRPYKEHMLPWIKATPYGKSAFDNKDDSLKPHQIIDGKVVVNKSKNSDKYKRQLWEKVAPCIHTRNDCLPSQNTIHPVDDRVFSIREIMLMMTVPDDFRWISDDERPRTQNECKQFFKKHDVNIRQCLGEAVPTAIFSSIATKIRDAEREAKTLSDKEIASIISQYELTDIATLKEFIVQRKRAFTRATVFKLCELANSNRLDNAAFYTRQDVCYAALSDLPNFEEKDTLHILEPSVGIGNFIYALAERYPRHQIKIDCVDIDKESLSLCKFLAAHYLPSRIKLNYINADFLVADSELRKSYDVVIGNPPYKKVRDSRLRSIYREHSGTATASNLYIFFLEKAMRLALNVSMIIPKSFLNSPEYRSTRDVVRASTIVAIQDFGETAFNVKIETIALVVKCERPKRGHQTKINSYRLKRNLLQPQSYFTESKFGSWLLYRDHRFDRICESLYFGCFDVFRDRELTKQNTKTKGNFRVIRARNIGVNGEVINIDGYDRYVDDVRGLAVGKFLNQDVILVPNLTYNPRAIKLPRNCVVDGSAAILIPKVELTDDDVAYFSSTEFKEFYQVARNYGTRSMNIDSVSVYYFGIKKKYRFK